MHGWHPVLQGHNAKQQGQIDILQCSSNKHHFYTKKMLLVAPLVLIIMELIGQPQRKTCQYSHHPIISHPPNLKYPSNPVNTDQYGVQWIDPIPDLWWFWWPVGTWLIWYLHTTGYLGAGAAGGIAKGNADWFHIDSQHSSQDAQNSLALHLLQWLLSFGTKSLL